jgi:hypothetical protein
MCFCSKLGTRIGDNDMSQMIFGRLTERTSSFLEPGELSVEDGP